MFGGPPLKAGRRIEGGSEGKKSRKMGEDLKARGKLAEHHIAEKSKNLCMKNQQQRDHTQQVFDHGTRVMKVRRASTVRGINFHVYQHRQHWMMLKNGCEI